MEQALDRERSEEEKRKLAWMSSWDNETVGVFSGIFKELEAKR
ncbi:hypothetical protein BCE02nite_53550 [Brevibacillus centrosporus]|nr:hypothetical protein BCE02nite_53550 [Brevibacillus centrosporus]